MTTSAGFNGKNAKVFRLIPTSCKLTDPSSNVWEVLALTTDVASPTQTLAPVDTAGVVAVSPEDVEHATATSDAEWELGFSAVNSRVVSVSAEAAIEARAADKDKADGSNISKRRKFY